jgi:excisionase family DNA binding protein
MTDQVLPETKPAKRPAITPPETQRERVQRIAFSMQEAADALGVSYISVHRLLKRGLLRSSTALRHKLIPATELERFLNSTLQ